MDKPPSYRAWGCWRSLACSSPFSNQPPQPLLQRIKLHLKPELFSPGLADVFFFLADGVVQPDFGLRGEFIGYSRQCRVAAELTGGAGWAVYPEQVYLLNVLQQRFGVPTGRFVCAFGVQVFAAPQHQLAHP